MSVQPLTNGRGAILSAWGGVRTLLALAALAALACVGWALPAHWSRPRPHALRSACWYWNRPFHLTEDERAKLRQARLERLYVYAATLVVRGSELRMDRVQQWESPDPCEVYAVVRVHPAANKAVLAPNGAARTAALIRKDPRLRSVRGIQWDADIPTGRLAEYARFLQDVRRSLSPRQALSVTALPDWLRSRQYTALCDAVDEVAPQFYGNRWPEPGQRPPPLWETADLMEAVRQSVRGRARVWVGLPAYGRCVAMDAAGRPIGVRHDLDPDRLMEDPAWEVEASETRFEHWAGRKGRVPVEDTLALRCGEAAAAGPVDAPAGTRLWFQWPRVDGLQSAIGAIRTSAPAGVEGICLLRWPAPGEPLSIPTAFMAAAARAQEPTDRSRSEPDLHLLRSGETVRVAVSNPGLDSPRLDGGMVLEVRPPSGAEVLADGPVSWRHGDEPVSARRGDRAVFSRPLLRPGCRWDACQVAKCRGPVQASLRWEGVDGQSQTQTVRESSVPPGGQEARRPGETR